MRARFILPLLALLSILPGPPGASAQGLPTAAQRASAVQCQQALLKATTRFFAKELAVLAKCNAKALDCVHQPKPEARNKCLLKGNACRDTLQGVLAKADNDLGGLIAEKCGPLTKDQLLEPGGIGYTRVDPECLSIGSELVDVTAIKSCLGKVYRRSIERLFAIESPRTRELFDVTGIDIATLPDLPGYPSCEGCSVTGDPKVAKGLATCGKSITTAGRSFAATAASLVSKCAIALFKCEQSPKPLSPAEVEVCRAKAQLQCEKAKAKAVELQRKVRTKVRSACTAIDFGVLKSQAGGNIGTLTCECTAVNVTTLDDLDDYLECSRLHHECRVAQLLRFAIPRLDDLLTKTKTTAKLEDILCAIPPDTETLAEARALPGCRICRFLSAIRGRFRRGGPLGPITKYAVFRPGGARKAAPGSGSPRAVPPAIITSIDGDRTYAPNQSREITVGYQVTNAALRAEPPKLLIAVERLDGSLVANDAFELELEPTIDETDLTVAYPATVPGESGCSFRLVFGIANGDDTEFTPLDLQAGECKVDGVKQPAEGCDPSDPNETRACDTNCTVARCGNGVTRPPESCDDGNVVDGDACPANCGVADPAGTPTPTLGRTPTPTRTPSPIPTPIVATVRFELASLSQLQGLQIRVDYSPAKGGFPGSADSVSCTTDSSADAFVPNDNEGTHQLTLTLADATVLVLPAEIRCTFVVAVGQSIAREDFPFTVLEVTQNSAPGDPSDLNVAVELGPVTPVRFVMTTGVALQGFLIRANYPLAKGGFSGSADHVICATSSVGTFVTNDDEGTSRLNLLMSRVPSLPFPIEIRCVFALAPGETLTEGDLPVTVAEVTENNQAGNPNDLDVDVLIP